MVNISIRNELFHKWNHLCISRPTSIDYLARTAGKVKKKIIGSDVSCIFSLILDNSIFIRQIIDNIRIIFLESIFEELSEAVLSNCTVRWKTSFNILKLWFDHLRLLDSWLLKSHIRVMRSDSLYTIYQSWLSTKRAKDSYCTTKGHRTVNKLKQNDAIVVSFELLAMHKIIKMLFRNEKKVHSKYKNHSRINAQKI